jgi:hypothetical protein
MTAMRERNGKWSLFRSAIDDRHAPSAWRMQTTKGYFFYRTHLQGPGYSALSLCPFSYVQVFIHHTIQTSEIGTMKEENVHAPKYREAKVPQGDAASPVGQLFRLDGRTIIGMPTRRSAETEANVHRQ